MREGARFRVFVLLAAPLLLAACNRPDLVTPTSTPTPESMSLEEIETAVAGTLAAEATRTAAARPSETEAPPEPTEEPSKTPEPTSVEPTEEPSCVVVSTRLNLRSGPGVVYDPPLRTVNEGTILLPFARNEDGSWLEGRLLDDPTAYWFSAGAQFSDCDVSPLDFPLGAIPPTPTPTNTPVVTATYTPSPTDTPKPTDEPTKAPPTNTPCPKFTNGFLRASVNVGTNAVSLTWGSEGGCSPITGTITATFKGERSPYRTYDIKGGSGKLTDNPPNRGCGSWDITYVLTLKDGSGQTITANASANIYWLC